MAMRDAVIRAGVIPGPYAIRDEKKRYSEQLSHELAIEVADALRACGFTNIRPIRETIVSGKHKGEVRIVKEKEFQGGLGPKRVDVSYSDDRHGLLLAVTIKSVNFPSFSKNLKNRFGDLTTEAITLHMRFPFAVVGCLYVMPMTSQTDKGPNMIMSTFERASALFATISGRKVYGDPPEQFEDVTLMLHQPLQDLSRPEGVTVKLYRAGRVPEPIEESQYFLGLRELYNLRNPHAMIGEEAEPGETDYEERPPENEDEPGRNP